MSTEFIHPQELSIFAEPWLSQGVNKVQYVDYRPLAPIRADTIINFFVPGTGSQYLDLKSTKLHMKLQITKPDGTAIGAADAVGLVAAPLSSMFSQVNIQLQQENITASDSLYPFKAYTEKLLNTCTGAGHPQSEAELHFLDGSPGLGTGNNMDQAEPEPKDPKLKKSRSDYACAIH